MPTWTMETEYVQTCNCAYGCPCNFNALPTTGSCEALNGFHVVKGAYNGTKLDGATFALGAWWPKAIHEGNGVGRYYVDPSVSAGQRKALEEIFAGRAGGGVWEIFPRTWSKYLPTKVAKVTWKFKGYDSSFSVDGVGAAECGHIKNPVTGADFQGDIVLPGGINWKHAHVVGIKKWWLKDPDAGWNMKHENVSGFVTVTKYTEKGPVSSTPP